MTDAAMRHFAEQGYHAAPRRRHRSRAWDRQGIDLQHFGSKDGLFFEVYKKGIPLIPRICTPLRKFESDDFKVLRYGG